MKKCPFCAEEIQDEAIKCKHCGEFLEGSAHKKESLPWYFSTSIIVLAILSVGPLALPLVWLHPKYSRFKKSLITLIVVVLTFFLLKAFNAALCTLNSYTNMMV